MYTVTVVVGFRGRPILADAALAPERVLECEVRGVWRRAGVVGVGGHSSSPRRRRMLASRASVA